MEMNSQSEVWGLMHSGWMCYLRNNFDISIKLLNKFAPQLLQILMLLGKISFIYNDKSHRKEKKKRHIHIKVLKSHVKEKAHTVEPSTTVSSLNPPTQQAFVKNSPCQVLHSRIEHVFSSVFKTC